MKNNSKTVIRIRGARQNSLKNLDIDLPLGELLVVTGVSGSGKSSLVFDTLYAEGQRRYVETFSPYARQFLDRMDRPQVDRIEGVPPAIAIDQTNPVRTSRSTVGTMTELADHLKLLFARVSHLYCRQCSQPVRRDGPDSIYRELRLRAEQYHDPRLVMTFSIDVPKNFSEKEVLRFLEAQGYTRILAKTKSALEVVQDRFRFSSAERERVIEALESALSVGHGRIQIHAVDDLGEPERTWTFSDDLHCADCDIHYREPSQGMFSFNSPVGACETCRGFGRVIGIDFGLIVPDEWKTLREGAIKPWQTKSFRECQEDLENYAGKRSIPLDKPWRELTDAQREWVLEGDSGWVNWRKSWPGTWYGVRHFFAWLESKAYKMHIRVLLSKYRAYTPCTVCDGSRLKHEALLWRVGEKATADAVLEPQLRYKPPGVGWSRQQLEELAGLTLHDLMLLPIDRCKLFFDGFHDAVVESNAGAAADEATDLLLREIRSRLGYLQQVGLGYLTLDRQSRTLSGGEVQRINLTTALGTSLTETLFVLDEPSIGLHPRDMCRVIDVMCNLRDAGNSMVVVEHDPQIMFAADRLIDMGPGPGEDGGRVMFFDRPAQLVNAESLTGDYLYGRCKTDADLGRLPVDASLATLQIEGASQNNLKNIDVTIPLSRLVCVTGVSGSGKSTLVQDVLYAAMLKHKGKPTDTPGHHTALRGHELITDVVMVDQTPIGRTTRSNPASYVGAFDAIRNLFSRAPIARERGYKPGMFSFNSGDGRCPACGGNGFEHVEMQFLSDVYLRCPECNGKRFRPEVLEVTIAPQTRPERNIAEVLEMTVSEAAKYFSESTEVLRRLQPLADVGLDYLRLGQPVPTLSGGEAQRLKLAGHLARVHGVAKTGTLFLFDEPTTGLHFDDIAKLLRSLRKLVEAGHSLVIIEHNLDVIAAADWIIDLGPEGGEGGGAVVCVGTPDAVKQHAASHTGRALVEYGRQLEELTQSSAQAKEDSVSRALDEFIRIRNAREHNLQNLDVVLPRKQFTVITGVSGSGKSTLAFDIVFGEGQRRYLESLNAYARQFVQVASRPDVDAIHGIPPTVAIEQRTSRGGRKSTVGTLTEIHHFLRLLFVKLGIQHCPDCEAAIEPQSEEAIAARILREYRGQHIGLLAPLVINRKGVYTDLARWAHNRGFDFLRIDGNYLPTRPFPRIDRFREHNIELPVADVRVSVADEATLRTALHGALDHGKGVVHVISPLEQLMSGGPMTQKVYSTKRACLSCGNSFPEPDPRLFSYNSRHGWCPACYGTGLRIADIEWDEQRANSGTEDHVLDSWIDWLEVDESCAECHGSRLNATALAVKWGGHSIADYGAQPGTDLTRHFGQVRLQGREQEIARDLIAELRSRLGFLCEVGLGYLTLDRSAPSLSGGEAQRIRLAAQLGSNLRGVCYILDEPTIGLHPRDNHLLLNTLRKLERKGNTLLVVEHDEDTIRSADHLVDLGPGAGRFGGRLIAQGSLEQLMACADSVTGRFLNQPLMHPLQQRRKVTASTPSLRVRKARLHNLRGVNVRFPQGRLTVVTGVSGSGKSTLARDVLHDNTARLVSERRARNGAVKLAGCDGLTGWQAVTRVLEVDQTPIGKTPRSCPATYVGFWDAIRKLFAGTQDARMRGFDPARFSFNTPKGRCSGCDGQGIRKIGMSFLPDVKVTCEFCNGARFDQETLSVKYKGKSIGDVLAMSVDEATGFFAAHSNIHHALRLLQDVGLGYLTLGQQSPTLSGGEAQRIKLVTELAKVRPAGQARSVADFPHTLYVLDEPTVGLHMADVEKLIHVLHRLVDANNTAVVIEHNLDVMANADWIVDLGPEGGADGGSVVVQGNPPEVAATSNSHTGKVLQEFLAHRTRPGGTTKVSADTGAHAD
jgi:excinuclease ABC subunit A